MYPAELDFKDRTDSVSKTSSIGISLECDYGFVTAKLYDKRIPSLLFIVEYHHHH